MLNETLLITKLLACSGVHLYVGDLVCDLPGPTGKSGLKKRIYLQYAKYIPGTFSNDCITIYMAYTWFIANMCVCYHICLLKKDVYYYLLLHDEH